MYTIGELAKAFQLSRSTLLYYDKIGLLQPTDRTGAGYRRYSDDAYQRMSQIALYKEMGLSLTTIAELLQDRQGSLVSMLEKRLSSLNSEIAALRQQQALIVKLLGEESALQSSRVIDKTQWVAMLQKAGMDEAAMWRWHAEFEQNLPEAHEDFLNFLGLTSEEISAIRQHASEGFEKEKPSIQVV